VGGEERANLSVARGTPSRRLAPPTSPFQGEVKEECIASAPQANDSERVTKIEISCRRSFIPPPRSGGGWLAGAKRRRVGWGSLVTARARFAARPPLADARYRVWFARAAAFLSLPYFRGGCRPQGGGWGAVSPRDVSGDDFGKRTPPDRRRNRIYPISATSKRPKSGKPDFGGGHAPRSSGRDSVCAALSTQGV